MKAISNDAAAGGGGMSRAAKKRAKKKQKQRLKERETSSVAVATADVSDESGIVTASTTGKKRPLEEEEDADEHRHGDNRDVSNAAAPHIKTGNDQHAATSSLKPLKHARTHDKSKQLTDEDSSREEDQAEEMIQAILSKLTPLQILQLANVDEAEESVNVASNNTTAGSEDSSDDCTIKISDLLQEATTRQRARALFQSLLGPTLSVQDFYQDYWEQRPLYIQASNSGDKSNHDTTSKRSRFHGFLSIQAIRELLETHPMYYGRDLNVTRYDKGMDGVKRRKTLDPQRQPDDNESSSFVLVEDVEEVWENYKSGGCSLRLLCPHKHNDALHALLSTLEWEWGCMVGANVYLTPQSSQGFAPHYDDIEAFCLQLEGFKHWKVYAPLNKAETLARTSSMDYTEDDLKDVAPVLDVVLGPGDLLYMPRGWIHQACATDRKNGDSLHLTVSVMQQWAWADFLELLLPEALEAAASSSTSTSLREGLPLRFLDYMGAVHDDTNEQDLPAGLQHVTQGLKDQSMDGAEENSNETSHWARKKKVLRDEFREEAKRRIMRVSKEALSMLDAASDQIGKRFISDRLPPALTATESQHTSESQSSAGTKVWPNTLVRLVRPGIARLALEDNKAVLYHCVDNSRVYQGNPLSPMEFEMDDAPALEMLLTTVEPHWIQVQDLIHDDIEDKMEIAQSLYDEGALAILQTDKPDKSVQVG